MVRSELPPIHLGELRRARIVIMITCPICRRVAEMSPDVVRVPDETTMNALGHAMRCTACNRKGGITCHPVPRQWVRYLRQTGQRHSEPWYAPIMANE